MTNEENEFIDALYRDYFEDLFIYVNSSLKNEFIAQDIVHDTFHLAVERADEFHKHPNPIGWLKVVVKNKLKEYYREQKAFLKNCRSLETLQTDIPDSRSDPALILTTESAESILTKLRAFLTEEEYYIFRRIRLEHASHLQIAKELNISVWNSQKHWERIKKRIEKFLKYLSD